MTIQSIICLRIARYAAMVSKEFLTEYWTTSDIDSDSSKPTEKDSLQGEFNSLTMFKRRIDTIIGAMEAAEFSGEYYNRIAKRLKDLSKTFGSKGPQIPQTVQLLQETYKKAEKNVQKLQNEIDAILKVENLETESTTAKPVEGSTPVAHDSVFNILFISDLHWAKDASHSRWKSVQPSFFESIKNAHKEVGGIDLIIFGGDLVYSGTEFAGKNSVSDFLESLQHHLSSVECKVPFLSVPGNHDLDRPVLDHGDDSPAVPVSAKFLDGLCESMFKRDSRDLAKQASLIKSAFKNYSSWSKANIEKQIAAGIFNKSDFRAGTIPGDFSFRRKKGKHQIGIVGLNSTFLQIKKGNFQGLLRLDRRQMDAVFPAKDTGGWLADNTINILVTHHPTNWLTKQAQKVFAEDIFTKSFSAHLFGHMHSPKWVGGLVPGTDLRFNLQSPSLFSTLKVESEDGKDEKRVCGYSILQIAFSDSSASLRLRPVTFNDDGVECPCGDIPVERSGWTKPHKIKDLKH